MAAFHSIEIRENYLVLGSYGAALREGVTAALMILFNIMEALLKTFWTLMSVLYSDVQMDQ